MGLVRSGEVVVLYASKAILCPPRAKVCGSKFHFASCPIGRMMASIGGGVGYKSLLRDGSTLVVERVSKSASSM